MDPTLIIVPTYNEAENIIPLLDGILSYNADVDILVVDDNSPDGTADLVSTMRLRESRVQLLKREGKMGLAKAYLAGFQWALGRGYGWICEMDADFSHRPEDLKRLLAQRENADFIVGSRWVSGGGTQGWTLLRTAVSMGGSMYARTILGFPLRDWTGGFNLWRARVLREIISEGVQSDGYCFQIELKLKALRRGFKGIELPILFADRQRGKSKMSLKIVLEAVWKVWKIKFK